MKLSPSEDWGRFSAYSEIIKDAERRTEDRIIKLLERLWEKTQGTDLPAVAVLPDAIALIKEGKE